MIDEKVTQFKRETSQLIEKVLYLTRNDNWDKHSFYQDMEERNRQMQKLGMEYSQQLEDEEKELTKKYKKDMEDAKDN